ncbi:tRNA lysidine(34) synthetase TilS [Clostridium omnivorum]|uniref:tRNA(Ile)-lysidine synthase n=1 Tax=Clostridium omnivorum TaxID=1604902 RepID=A0ABQ5N426_9CLOT|nr:tRNA lysidine(34) synthetase TilS [Clostridium sp. E14]GLC29941.1 tRNA(Ile)-lysidine synthase [Clostridium sp. E14]
MKDKVLKAIKQYSMLKNGDKIIVAVSGGPDSICLLHILHTLKDEFNLELIAAHVNHCLRGKEADEDEKYVEEYCKKNDIKFFSKRVDINRLAMERNLSSESAGREARYEFFHKLMKEHNADKIALAHNANDQAETVLMRIMRGTGIEGLVGIKPVRGNIFIRPLINITRDEIENYCMENNLKPRIDKTNLENIYARNKVRLELIPYIKENFNEDIVNTLNRLSQTVSTDNDYLEYISIQSFKKYCDKNCDKVIINKDAFKEHEAVITRVIRHALLSLKGSLNNFEKVHIYDIIHIQNNSTGKKVVLPENIIAQNNYGNIELYIREENKKVTLNNEYVLEVNCSKFIEELNITVTLQLLLDKRKINVKEQNYIKYFDFDKIKGEMLLRKRKDGDRFTPLGMRGSKKLKDLFIDLKIPQPERDSIPLICFGEDIAWIVGYRLSDKFKITKDTKNVLEIKIERGAF